MSRRAWGSSLLGVLFIVLSALPSSAVSVSPPTDFESRLLVHINNHRADIGCPKLTYNYHLAYAARKHTAKMVAARKLSHQLSGEPSLGSRITAAGYTPWRLLAENLAYGTTTPWSTYKLWMGSGPHRANIENCSLRNAGIGTGWTSGKSWNTIDFGRQ